MDANSLIPGDDAAEENFPAEWYALSDADHFWMQWRLNAWRRMTGACGIAHRRETPTAALEIGCGIGTLRKQVEDATSWSVDGCDTHPAAASQQVDTRGQYLEMDIFSGPDERKGAYEHLFLFDVLEHIDDDINFLKAACTYARPAGVVHINVPASQLLFSRYDTIAGHLRRHTTKSLSALAEGAGIQIHACGYWGLFLVPIAGLRKLMLATLGRGMTDSEVLRRGFQPPGALVNQSLAALGRMETSLFPQTWLGTSVMLVGTIKHSNR